MSRRMDGWYSSLTGLGVPGYDKRESTSFLATFLNDFTIEQLWRSDDIAARIIETIPNESLRRGFRVKVEGDKELAEDVTAVIEELGVVSHFAAAKKLERAYGGGAVFPYANDGNKRLSDPLDETRIKSVEHLMTLEPRELQPATYYKDLTKPRFGLPETYRLQPISLGGGASRSEEIHESRLITFDGIRVSRTYRGVSGWGDSVMNRVWAVLRDFNVAFGSAGVLINDFGQTVIKIKGLAELMSQDKDEVVQTRLRTIELSRSTIRAVLMDAEEELERKQTSIAGLAELLDRFATRLAAAADMPVTLLMGQSPAGLNATGESDVRFFYDRVAQHQEIGLRPGLERLVKMVLLSKDGPTRGKEPDNWSVEFNPLWQPSESETATARSTQAGTDEKYINLGVLTPDEVARSRFGGDTYSFETSVDFEERERLAEMMTEPTAPTPEGQPGAPTPEAKVEEVEVETGDVDEDGQPDEYVTISVQGHQRRVKLRRRRQDLEDLLGDALASTVRRALARRDEIVETDDGKFCVYAKDGSRVGEYDTREEAEERMRDARSDARRRRVEEDEEGPLGDLELTPQALGPELWEVVRPFMEPYL